LDWRKILKTADDDCCNAWALGKSEITERFGQLTKKNFFSGPRVRQKVEGKFCKRMNKRADEGVAKSYSGFFVGVETLQLAIEN